MSAPPAASGEPTTRVLIADEQPAARAFVRRTLEREGFEVCCEAGDAETAVAQAAEALPEICLVDVLLPGDAIAAIAAIAARVPAVAIVVLTASRDRDHLFDAVRAGAAGYLLKDTNPERLPAALRGVLAGEAAIPRTLVASLVSELQSRGRRRLVVGSAGRVELSRREWEVADLLAAGLDTAEIAARLAISPVTVRRHLSQLVTKLGVRDRAAAIRLLNRSDEGR